MSIIFYEYEYCKNIIENGVKKITQRDLNYLAKYWEYIGEKPHQIRKNIEDFCLKNNSNFNLIQSSLMIKRAISHCKNNRLRIPKPIFITQSEINRIRYLDNYAKEKFLFAMFLSAKFFHNCPGRKKFGISKYSNTLYSNNSIRDIQLLAGTKFTKKDWKIIKHEFTIKGLISPTIIGSSRWAIGFDDDNSGSCILVDDYRNIISYYQEYLGEKMTRCKGDGCNVLIAKKSNRHFFCSKCWNIRNKKQVRERVDRHRKNVTV